MSKVSIITPVYNSSQFIIDTVKSIQNQTLIDWLLILVDDCSTDNSFDIIKACAALDNRIIILSTERNSGPAKARNIGIEFAINHDAEFLAFIDSDDIYESNFLELMVDTAVKNSADIVWCNILDYQIGEKEKSLISSHRLKEGSIDNKKELMSLFLKENPGLGSMVNKIYRTSFIEQQHTRINEERVRAEDWEFNLMLFQQSPRVFAIEAPLYHYVHQERPSVMATFREKDFEMYKRSLSLLRDVAKKWNLEEYLPNQYANFIYNSICYLSLGVMSNQPIRQLKLVCADNFLQDVLRKKISWRNLTLKQKLYAYILKYRFYNLFLMLVKRLK